MKTLSIDMNELTGFSLSPDGKTIGIKGKGKGGESGPIDFYSAFFDLASGKRVGPPLLFNGPGNLSDEGTTAYFDWLSVQGSEILVRDIASGKGTIVANVEDGRDPFAFTPDGQLLVTGCQAGLGFFKVPSGNAAFAAIVPTAKIRAMSAIYASGTRIATLHNGGVVLVWDLTTGKQTDAMKLNRTNPQDEMLLVASDGRAMVTHDEREMGEFWDLSTKRKFKWGNPPLFKTVYPMAGGSMYYLDSKTEQTTIPTGGKASVTADCKFFTAIADMETGRVRYRLLMPDQTDYEASQRVETSADGKRVVMLSPAKRRVYIWDLPATR